MEQTALGTQSRDCGGLSYKMVLGQLVNCWKNIGLVSLKQVNTKKEREVISKLKILDFGKKYFLNLIN